MSEEQKKTKRARRPRIQPPQPPITVDVTYTNGKSESFAVWQVGRGPASWDLLVPASDPRLQATLTIPFAGVRHFLVEEPAPQLQAAPYGHAQATATPGPYGPVVPPGAPYAVQSGPREHVNPVRARQLRTATRDGVPVSETALGEVVAGGFMSSAEG